METPTRCGKCGKKVNVTHIGGSEYTCAGCREREK